MQSIGRWLQATELSQFVVGHAWVWPLCETLHFLGLIALVGTIGLFDLRMLGVVRDLPARPLNRFVRVGVAGFVVNLLTGLLFFVGTPDQYIGNPAFTWKAVFIALAGLNVVAFYATGTFRKVESLAAGEHAAPLAKIIAATSLLLWFGVMYFGRMLPYLGDAF